jgi:hypothetical protein
VSDADGFFDPPDFDPNDPDLVPGVERDGSGQPLIRQPDGSRLAYTRASSLGDFITEQAHLHVWELRYLARQLGKNEDLAALAGLETYSTGFDEDSVTKSQSGKRLDDIIRRALDRGRIHERADYGTVIHARTEPSNEGYTPIRAAVDMHAFWELIEENGVKIGGTELFTVNDKIRSAGTFDHLVWTEQYGWTIADKKNGRNINGLGFSAQFASYGYGELYDPQTETRSPLTTLTGGEPINLDVAILFEVKDGQARARAVPIGPERGWKAAQLAAEVRDARKWNAMANIDKSFKQVSKNKPGLRQRAIIRRINEAQHAEELIGIWRYYGPDGTSDWPADRNHEISKAATAKKELEGWK